ncbi:MAG: hypothetical protein IAX21_09355 [Candidatus Bathyarchaeota archaeon]|nr:MAG: hypothetical protein IAX21_09355 [Candidatus Bathyarchaeota archaeon]
MNRDPYVTALNNALTEIQKAYPDITHSFIFTDNGATYAGETETDATMLNKVLESFEELKQKTKAIGNITKYSVNCENGKLYMSNINGMYFMLATNENADDAQIYSLTHVVIPPLLKTLQTFAGQKSAQMDSIQNSSAKNVTKLQNNPTGAQSHLQEETAVNLVVNPLSGFFDGDSVQIDETTLNDWSENEADGEDIKYVKIETINGKSTRCKVKKITVGNMKGKNFIRMPAKYCDVLKVKGGDRVNVSPDL